MVKRISCRVIRSVPLSESGEARPYASQSDNMHHEIDDVVASNIGLRHPHNSVTYTSRLDTARVCADDGPTGQILDCYI